MGWKYELCCCTKKRKNTVVMVNVGFRLTWKRGVKKDNRKSTFNSLKISREGKWIHPNRGRREVRKETNGEAGSAKKKQYKIEKKKYIF